jgi:uncharacterized protein (TIRG00374 family)
MALDKRLRRLLALALIASLLSLLAVFAFSFGIQRDELVASLTQLNPAVFAIAIGLHALALLLWAARLYALADGSGHTQSGWVCIEAVFSSVFAAAVTPARFGGEPVRFGILTSRDMPPREGSLIVLLERGLDILLFILIGVWAFVALVPRLPQSALLALVVPISIVFLVALISIPLLVLFKPRAAHPFLDLTKRVVGRERIENAKDWLVLETARMRRALATVLGRKPSRFVFAVFATIASWMLEFGVLYYLLNVGFGHDINFVTVALGAGLVSVLTTIPLLPGGSGLAEAGVLGVYAPFTSGLTATFVLVWRASTYYFDLVVGGIVALRFAGAETIRALSGEDEDDTGPDPRPATPGSDA